MGLDALAAVSEEDRQKGLSRDQIQEVKIFIIQCANAPGFWSCISLPKHLARREQWPMGDIDMTRRHPGYSQNFAEPRTTAVRPVVHCEALPMRECP